MDISNRVIVDLTSETDVSISDMKTEVDYMTNEKYTKKSKAIDAISDVLGDDLDESLEENKKIKPAKRKKTVNPKKPKASGSCEVCCENFDTTKQSLTDCPRCPYRACRSCHERYLLNSISVPHCMNCRNRWTYKDLLTLFNKTFVNTTFRKQRGKHLLDRAKSHIPLAMPYVDAEMELKKINEEIKPLSTEFKSLRKEIRLNRTYETNSQKNLEALYMKYYSVSLSLSQKNQIKNKLLPKTYSRRNRKRTETYTAFEEPCPVNDCRGFIEKAMSRCGICKTFVCRKCTHVLGKLTDKFTNNTIEKKIADVAYDEEDLDKIISSIEQEEKREKIMDDMTTNEMIVDENAEFDEKKTSCPSDEKRPEMITVNGDEEEETTNALTSDEKKQLTKLKKAHTCKQEDIDSIKEIRQHSRACPNCKARIFRISGCDTMWCTKCNTGFNWRTGIVIKDARDLHNPHYIDFVRNNPGFQYNSQNGGEEKKGDQKMNQMDNPCDRITIDTIVLPDSITTFRRADVIPGDSRLRSVITDFQQQMLHVRDYARRKFATGNQYDEIDYALRYLTKQWDEKRWRIMVEHHDRFSQTNQEYIDVILTWLVVMNDLFNIHLSSRLKVEDSPHFIEQMKKITEYTNQTLTEMNTLYKRKTTLIALPHVLWTTNFMDELKHRIDCWNGKF